MSRKPRTVNSTRAPLRASTNDASAPLNRVFTGTSTPPALVTPSAAMIHSSEFGAQIATRSPRSIPTASNARAAASTRSRRSVKSTRRSPSTTASVSPHRPATSRSIAGIDGHSIGVRVALTLEHPRPG